MKTTHITSITLLTGALFFTGCAGGPLSTREKGAGIGALAGGGSGALYTYKVRNRFPRY